MSADSMDAGVTELQSSEYYLVSAAKIASFTCLFVLWSSFLQRYVFTGDWWPALSAENAAKGWRRRNTAVSFTHSFVSGFWALSSFFLYPDTMSDMIFAGNGYNYHMTLFSLGYFVYDVQDMMRHERSSRTYELLFHHAVCLLSFSSGVAVNKFYPFAAVALLMELNSIFLHLRLLVSLHGLPKSHDYYRLISLGNIGSFLIFRLLLIGWMLRWVLSRRDILPLFFFNVGSWGLASMVVVNLCLFYRLLVADGFLTTRATVSLPSPTLCLHTPLFMYSPFEEACLEKAGEEMAVGSAKKSN